MPSISRGFALGPYRTQRPLSELRGDGLVEPWLSDPPDGQEQVVLNIIRIPHFDVTEEQRRAYVAFGNEVEILKKARHLNVVKIFPLDPKAMFIQGDRYLSQMSFEDESWWFWVMEYLQGGSLASRMEQVGRLHLVEAAEIIYQIAVSLDYIHSKGIAYLNIHPRNIFFRHSLVGPELQVELVLVNFRNAIPSDEIIGGYENLEGVEFKAYVAPERIRPRKVSPDQPLDHRPTDIYALGVLFYHMLAGVLPFTGSDEDIERAILVPDPAPLPRFDVPTGIKDLIFQTLYKNPADRPSLEQLMIGIDMNVPPPRTVRGQLDISVREESIPSEGVRAQTAPFTPVDASQPPIMPIGVGDTTPSAPSFSTRLKRRWAVLTKIFRPSPYPPPKLLEPVDEAILEGQVTFAWDWDRELKDDEAFELRVWREGQGHERAGQLQQVPESEIDLDTLVLDLPGEGDQLFWSVAVVQKSPYRSLSDEYKPRSFIYGELPPEPEEEEEDDDDVQTS
jgi:serine/threonine protein kinase